MIRKVRVSVCWRWGCLFGGNQRWRAWEQCRSNVIKNNVYISIVSGTCFVKNSSNWIWVHFGSFRVDLPHFWVLQDNVQLGSNDNYKSFRLWFTVLFQIRFQVMKWIRFSNVISNNSRICSPTVVRRYFGKFFLPSSVLRNKRFLVF